MHAEKCWGNGYYQNIQTNTCKNRSGKPVFMRGSGGYRRNERGPFRALTRFWVSDCQREPKSRNERGPFRALTHSSVIFFDSYNCFVEMREARLGHTPAIPAPGASSVYAEGEQPTKSFPHTSSPSQPQISILLPEHNKKKVSNVL